MTQDTDFDFDSFLASVDTGDEEPKTSDPAEKQERAEAVPAPDAAQHSLGGIRNCSSYGGVGLSGDGTSSEGAGNKGQATGSPVVSGPSPGKGSEEPGTFLSLDYDEPFRDAQAGESVEEAEDPALAAERAKLAEAVEAAALRAKEAREKPLPAEDAVTESVSFFSSEESPKKRGRPKGSKNKVKDPVVVAAPVVAPMPEANPQKLVTVTPGGYALSDEMINRICLGARVGIHPPVIAAMVGIPEAQLREWLAQGIKEERDAGSRYGFFAREYKSALAELEADTVRRLLATGNPRALAFYLERRWPERWAPRDTQRVIDGEASAIDEANQLASELKLLGDGS